MWVQAATTMGAYQEVANAAVAATPATDAAPPILKSSSTAQATQSGDPYSTRGDNPLGLPQWLQKILEPVRHQETPNCPRPQARLLLRQLGRANYLQNFGDHLGPRRGHRQRSHLRLLRKPSLGAVLGSSSPRTLRGLSTVRHRLVPKPGGGLFSTSSAWELFDMSDSTSRKLLIYLSPESAGTGVRRLAPRSRPPVRRCRTGRAWLPFRLRLLFRRWRPLPLRRRSCRSPGRPQLFLRRCGRSAPARRPRPERNRGERSRRPAATDCTAATCGWAGFFAPPYIVGGPTMESWMSAKAKTHEPTSRGASRAPAAAAAVAAAAKEPTRSRRRQRAKQRGQADEYMDMNVDVDPDWGTSTAASDRGAGPLGFSGTVSKGSEQAAGLATLSDDGYGNGPSMPMLPNTWSPEGEETDG